MTAPGTHKKGTVLSPRRSLGPRSSAYVSGSSKAWATIDDLDATEWVGTIGEIRNISPRSGLHTIRIGEGDRAGAFAVMEVDYDERRRSGSLAGGTPFGTDPIADLH